MALSQGLYQKQLQKLSPQQIQLMKLLQVPTALLEERIKEELEENPALETGEEEETEEFGLEIGVVALDGEDPRLRVDEHNEEDEARAQVDLGRLTDAEPQNEEWRQGDGWRGV